MTGTAIVKAETPRDRAVAIEEALESRAEKLMAVMPDGMDGKRFMRATLTAISRNPDLLACTPESIITAVFDAAEVGLVPTGSLNRAWLVPQRHKVGPDRWVTRAELRIGYQGLSDLARQSGQVVSIECRPVYQGDDFAVFYGTDPFIKHTPAFGADDGPATMTHVYAVAILRDGSRTFEVMTKAQIEGIRARAPGANKGPWATDYVQMARKSVMRRLCNYLPLTPEAQGAIQKDDERENAPRQIEAGPTRSSEVKALLDKRAGAPEPVQNDQGDEIEGEVAAVTPDEAPEPPGAATEPLCGKPSPYTDESPDSCILAPDHKRTHKGPSGATW